MMKRKPIEQYTADELESTAAKAEEQEFTMTAYRDEDAYDVWVTDNTMLTKMKKLMKKAPEHCKLIKITWTREGRPFSYEFKVARKCLRLSTPRTMSEENKEKARARAKATPNLFGRGRSPKQ